MKLCEKNRGIRFYVQWWLGEFLSQTLQSLQCRYFWVVLLLGVWLLTAKLMRTAIHHISCFGKTSWAGVILCWIIAEPSNRRGEERTQESSLKQVRLTSWDPNRSLEVTHSIIRIFQKPYFCLRFYHKRWDSPSDDGRTGADCYVYMYRRQLILPPFLLGAGNWCRRHAANRRAVQWWMSYHSPPTIRGTNTLQNQTSVQTLQDD